MDFAADQEQTLHAVGELAGHPSGPPRRRRCPRTPCPDRYSAGTRPRSASCGRDTGVRLIYPALCYDSSGQCAGPTRLSIWFWRASGLNSDLLPVICGNAQPCVHRRGEAGRPAGSRSTTVPRGGRDRLCPPVKMLPGRTSCKNGSSTPEPPADGSHGIGREAGVWPHHEIRLWTRWHALRGDVTVPAMSRSACTTTEATTSARTAGSCGSAAPVKCLRRLL